MNYMNMYEKIMEQKRITYLTPVLVRDTDQGIWEIDIFITRDINIVTIASGTYGNSAFRSKVTWLS